MKNYVSRKGDEMIRNVKQGQYSLLWVMTPSSWHARSKRKEPKLACLQQILQNALDLKMHVVIFGPPGYLWKQPQLQALADDQLL